MSQRAANTQSLFWLIVAVVSIVATIAVQSCEPVAVLKSQPAFSESERGDLQQLIKASDDFKKYESSFMKSTEGLMRKGYCQNKDFKEYGTWTKSENYRQEPVYFAYCGGFKIENKIYLNTVSGDVRLYDMRKGHPLNKIIYDQEA